MNVSKNVIKCDSVFERIYHITITRFSKQNVFHEFTKPVTTRDNIIEFINRIYAGGNIDSIRLQVQWTKGCEVKTTKYSSFVIMREYMKEMGKEIKGYEYEKLDMFNRRELIGAFVLLLPMLDCIAYSREDVEKLNRETFNGENDE